MNQELETLSLRILGALFNGGYQGLLLALVVWSGLKLFPHTNASTRHAAGLATLLVVASLPVVHFLMATAPVRRIADSGLRKQVPTKERPELTTKNMVAATPGPARRRLPRKAAPDALTGTAGVVEMAPLTAWREGVPTVAADRVQARSGLVEDASASHRRWWPAMQQWRASLPGKLAFGLIGFWVAFASIRMGKLIMECRHLWLLKLHGGPAPEWLGASFDAMRREMRVRREARLLIVQGPSAPMAVGYWKPAVLLSTNLFPCAGGLEPILRHELAHLRRGDDWSNLIQQGVKALFFFHPGVWWLSKRLTLDREIACDDHVLAATSARKDYALLLTEFAGRTHYLNCSAAPAGWSRKSQLKERITMILDSKRNSSTNLSKPRAATVLAVAALLAALSLHAAPRLELAQTVPGPAEPASVIGSAASSHTATTGSAVDVRPVVSTVRSSGSVSSIHAVGAGVAIAASGPRPKPMPVPQPDFVVPVPPAAAHPAHPAHPPHAPVPPDPFVYEDVDVDLSDLEVKLADLDVKLADLDPQLDAEPGAPKRKERDGESMEARVERLEKLIESLMERGGKNPDVGSGKGWKWDGKPGDHEIDMAFKWSSDLQGKMEKDLNWERISGPEIEKITRQAQQEAQRAVREAQQQAQRAVRDAQRMAEESRRAGLIANIANDNEMYVRNARRVQSPEVQRKMLEAQRHALEMQMNNLEAQIERLEEERDRIEERVDEHEELLENLDEEISAEEEREHEHTSDEAVEDSGDKRKEESSDAPRPKKAL